MYDYTNNSLTFLSIKYEFIVDKLFELPVKGDKYYKVHFNFTREDFKIETAWYIPRDVVQYITPNEA